MARNPADWESGMTFRRRAALYVGAHEHVPSPVIE